MAVDQRIAAARLLHRFGFGPSGTEYAAAATTTPELLIAQLLASSNDANAAADRALTPVPAFGYIDKTMAISRQAAEDERRAQERAAKLWWLDRMVTTQQPLLERLTWFWHGHWATSEIKVRDTRLMLLQNETLRALALGDFRLLSKQMLRDPAMLIWLDGRGSKAGRPNENLGREFLELFTLGEGNYSEHDVRESARALTGWQLDLPAGTATRNDRLFDAGIKTVLSVTAALDVDALAEVVVAQPQCAAFIATRLWRHVSPDVTLTPELLLAAAAAFGPARSTGALVSALANQLAVTEQPLPWAKSPVDWLVSTLRALELRPSELPQSTQTGVLNDLGAMGQIPFFPPNVSGWPAGSSWLSAASTQARVRCTQRIVTSAPRWLRQATPRQRPVVLADRLGVPAWSAPTQRVLSDAANSARDAVILALNSPDYLVGV